MKEVQSFQQRYPGGRFQGSLQPFSAPRLARLRTRAVPGGIEPAAWTMHHGCVCRPVSARLRRARPRLRGLSNQVAALTINKVCGSSLKAVAWPRKHPDGKRRNGRRRRMESMTNAPICCPRLARLSHGNGALVMRYQTLWEVYNNFHMAWAREDRGRYGISGGAGHFCGRVASPRRFARRRFLSGEILPSRFRRQKERNRGSSMPTNRSA